MENDIQSALHSLESAPVAVLSPQALEILLRDGEILREEDTHMRDMIRIIDWQGTILVQETSNRDEFLIRKLASRDEAMELVEDRLKRYEMMWDG